MEIKPYTVISKDMFTTTEFTGFIKDSITLSAIRLRMAG